MNSTATFAGQKEVGACLGVNRNMAGSAGVASVCAITKQSGNASATWGSMLTGVVGLAGLA
jgi:hypothetical protein